MLKSGDTELGKLTRLASPLRISVFLPESLVQADRTFFLVVSMRVWREKLPAAFDAASAALTFDTDRFSTYALGYTDPPASPTRGGGAAFRLRRQFLRSHRQFADGSSGQFLRHRFR